MVCLGIFLVLALAGCGTHEEAKLTLGDEGFDPPVQTVPAGRSFDLNVANDTKEVHEVTVEGSPPLRVPPGGKNSRQVQPLSKGDHKVTVLDAPFEATLRAEE